MAIFKGLLASVLFFFLHLTHSTQGQLSPKVTNVQPTSALVSWTSSDTTDVTVTLVGDEDTQTWPTNNEPERALSNLKQFTQYKVCVFQTQYTNQSSQILGEEECVDFRTPFTERTLAAFGCAAFLILSFFIITILDFICGTVGPNSDQLKQEELLEKGNKIFKTRRRARRKAAKLAQKQNAAKVDGKGKGKALRNRASIMSDASSEAPLSTAGEDFDINQWLASGMGEPQAAVDTNRLSVPLDQYGRNFHNVGDTPM